MTDKESIGFVYDPLPESTSFRLLEPQKPAEDGTLSFRLQVFDIRKDRDVPYYCLSYTWGNPFAHGGPFEQHFETVASQYDETKAHRILVNGQTLFVRKNIYDALNMLEQDDFREAVNTHNAINGRTLLHNAAGRGKVDLIKTWLDCGADVNQVDNDGHNALHFAAGNGQARSVPVLLQYGCNIVENALGEAPMDVVRRLGHTDVEVELNKAPEPRNIPLARTKIYVWIDSISINQDDVKEKSAQVAIMDRIYALATYVVAWLGPSDESSDVALQTLNTLSKHLQAFQDSNIEPFSGKDKDKYTEAGIPYITLEEWDDLGGLYQRQWFRRSWIVQEALLSPYILMYIGKKLVPWHDLGEVAEAIRYLEAKLGTTGSTSFVPIGEVAVSVTWNMAELYRWRRQISRACRDDEEAKEYQAEFTPSRLAYNTITFNASDPRDKVFAYYGLLNLFADRRSTDYGLSISAVYTRATREIIASEGNLYVLSWCVNPVRRDRTLPSWVPDFGISGANAVPRSFTADKGLEYVPPSTDDLYNPVLRIRGAFVGPVTLVSGRSGKVRNEKLRFDRSWLTLPLSLQGKGRGALSCILWQTLCMNMSAGGMFDPEEYGEVAPDELGLQFRTFVLLLILAAADGKIRAKLALDETHAMQLIYSHLDYDPMQEDMEPILADLDAFEEHDGPGCWLPNRALVLKYWNEYKYSLLRATEVEDDDGPVDFYLPDGVTAENSRAVGVDYVLLSSRPARQCQGFINAYSTMYGGRQLITCGKSTLGLASVAVEAGDELWLIPGLNAPAVLRPVPGEEDDDDGTPRRQFLGSCFLWGVMHGTLADVAKDEVQDLELV